MPEQVHEISCSFDSTMKYLAPMTETPFAGVIESRTFAFIKA
ncbi:MAG: hypothetical protein PVF50_07040 [Gammaproteobacteria bacterium]|jgi:hypothetical protein